MIFFALLVLLALGTNTSAASIGVRQRPEPTAAISDYPENFIPILRNTVDGPNPDGSYAYSFETANGIKAEEQGELKPEGEAGTASVRGSYSYRGDDGVDIVLSYVADENGFQPEGAHLPVAPPIPDAILKALEWIAAHPEEDNLKK